MLTAVVSGVRTLASLQARGVDAIVTSGLIITLYSHSKKIKFTNDEEILKPPSTKVTHKKSN